MIPSNTLSKLLNYALSYTDKETQQQGFSFAIKKLIPQRILHSVIRELQNFLKIINDVLLRLLRLSYAYQGTQLDITKNNPPLKGQLNYIIGVKISAELMLAASKKLAHQSF